MGIERRLSAVMAHDVSPFSPFSLSLSLSLSLARSPAIVYVIVL